jgi:hypothetical protein
VEAIFFIHDFLGFVDNGKKAPENYGDGNYRAMDEITLFVLENGSDDIHLTARIDGESGTATETAENICAKVTSALNSCGMRILNERVFGTLDFYQSYTRIRKKHHHFAQSPFSYIQGMPVHGHGLCGIQIHAVKPVSDENPRVFYDKKHPCGSVWKKKDITYVYIAGVHGLQTMKAGRERGTSLSFKVFGTYQSARG